MCEQDDVCTSMIPVHLNATCYKGGYLVKENHQVCDVKSRLAFVKCGLRLVDKKIVDLLPGQPPQVTFTCNRPDAFCGFQCMMNLNMNPDVG